MLCLFTVAASGKVFLRWGSGSKPTRFIEASGGEHAYSANVSLNGGSGKMAVYSFHDDIIDVVNKFKKSVKFDKWAWNMGSMAKGTSSSGGKSYNYIITSFKGSSQTLVFLVEQTAIEAERSSSPPKEHMLKNIPSYPASTPEFFMKNKDTAAEISVASTTDPAHDVYSFYHLSLRAQGWISALPEKDLSKTQSLRFYIKGSSMCCLMANSSGTDETTSITLLHKQPTMK